MRVSVLPVNRPSWSVSGRPAVRPLGRCVRGNAAAALLFARRPTGHPASRPAHTEMSAQAVGWSGEAFAPDHRTGGPRHAAWDATSRQRRRHDRRRRRTSGTPPRPCQLGHRGAARNCIRRDRGALSRSDTTRTRGQTPRLGAQLEDGLGSALHRRERQDDHNPGNRRFRPPEPDRLSARPRASPRTSRNPSRWQLPTPAPRSPGSGNSAPTSGPPAPGGATGSQPPGNKPSARRSTRSDEKPNAAHRTSQRHRMNHVSDPPPARAVPMGRPHRSEQASARSRREPSLRWQSCS